MDKKDKFIQTGGSLEVWQDPEKSYHHLFIKLDLDSEHVDFAGILIISDENKGNIEVLNIKSLRRELPSLLIKRENKVRASWWRENDANERNCILSALTRCPKLSE